MNRVLIVTTAVLFGLIIGALSALSMSGLIGRTSALAFADVTVDDWASDWSIGSASADPYTRARVARHGLLALSKNEAVYFTRRVDEGGETLTSQCRYELSGNGQDAEWWSITLYDAQSQLPSNTDDALSLDATQVGDVGSWSATIAATKPASGLWLSSRGADQFDLTLRIYRPSAEIIETPESAVSAPSVRKLDCGGEA